MWGKACGSEFSGDLILLSILLPVLDVNISDTSNEHFELTLVEGVDETPGMELVESDHEGVGLLLNAVPNATFVNESITMDVHQGSGDDVEPERGRSIDLDWGKRISFSRHLLGLCGYTDQPELEQEEE